MVEGVTKKVGKGRGEGRVGTYRVGEDEKEDGRQRLRSRRVDKKASVRKFFFFFF